MIAAFCHAAASLGERLFPSFAASLAGPRGSGEAAGEAGRAPMLLGLSELSAMLRLFFPSKPREHLSALKIILEKQAKQVELPAADVETLAQDVAPEVAAVEAEGAQKLAPPVVDLVEVLGTRLPPGRIDMEVFVGELIQCPAPLVLELRRQHIIESFMFLDRVQKAFRGLIHRRHRSANESGALEGEGHALQVQVTAEQAEAALKRADLHLTESQRHLYLLRGFGRRLPDMPSSRGGAQVEARGTVVGSDVFAAAAGALGSLGGRKVLASGKADVVAKELRVQKMRRILKERASQLFDEGATVLPEEFVTRLASTGVAKGARMWVPEISIADITQESGIAAMRKQTASAPLEAFLTDPQRLDAEGGTGEGGSAGPGGHDAWQEPPDPNRNCADWYRSMAEAARDMQELSVGYPALALSYWVVGAEG